MWTTWHQQNLDWTGQDRIGSHCSFRFADLMWFSIIWSCILNSTWDFDLAMGSSKVNQFVNYGFQQWKKLKNVKKQLDCVAFFLTDWWNDTYLELAFIHGGTTLHSLTQPWKWLHGVLGQKKTPRGAHPLLCHFVLACYTKILFYMVRSMILDPWFNPWSGARSDPWSDPVRSRFCRRRKLEVILGHFRSF